MEFDPDYRRALRSALEQLLRPLCRLLLRHSVSFSAFADMAKRVYVDVALKDFSLPGKKPTTSRVAVLSGLTRKEVHRILADPVLDGAEGFERYTGRPGADPAGPAMPSPGRARPAAAAGDRRRPSLPRWSSATAATFRRARCSRVGPGRAVERLTMRACNWSRTATAATQRDRQARPTRPRCSDLIDTIDQTCSTGPTIRVFSAR